MERSLFEFLEKDHETIKDILGQLEQTTDGERKKRDELFARLKQEIIPHMKAEESVFYPALRDEEAHRNALIAAEEHRAALLILGEMDRMPKDDERWEAKLSVLRNLVINHIEEEESTLFEDAREILTDEEMDDLFTRFKDEKEKAAKTVKAGRKRAA
jgi:hemerythrin-like domain-containing protein